MPETKHHAVLRLRLKHVSIDEAARIMGISVDQFLKHPLSEEQLQHIRKQAKIRNNGK